MAAVVLLIVLLVLGGSLSWRYLNTPLNVTEPVLFDVAAGSSLNRISSQLGGAGYLDYPRLFGLWARLRGAQSLIHTGEYELLPETTPVTLLHKMLTGDVKQYAITLVEGWTLRQALNVIGAQDTIDRRLQDHSPRAVADALAIPHENPEGLFYPDTYFYTRGTSDIALLQRAHQRLNGVLESAWENRLGALPYDTPYEALIMASIIERESSLAAERGHIAGVFVRRLETGMRLQSDPTVIYGMADRFDGDIRRNDLQEPTAYNTYRINGLPPTPIALAGRDSILAALNPLPSDYLYFVSTGDGSHYFSSSLEEHNDAVRRYQLQQGN
ncbi:MAG: endolytic transglycosylase MltG [Pseudohongiellaceae bacterium]